MSRGECAKNCMASSPSPPTPLLVAVAAEATAGGGLNPTDNGRVPTAAPEGGGGAISGPLLMGRTEPLPTTDGLAPRAGVTTTEEADDAGFLPALALAALAAAAADDDDGRGTYVTSGGSGGSSKSVDVRPTGRPSARLSLFRAARRRALSADLAVTASATWRRTAVELID